MYRMTIEYGWEKSEFRFESMMSACTMAEMALEHYVKDAERSDEVRVIITKEEIEDEPF